MRWYWSCRSFPEMAKLSEGEQDRVLREAYDAAPFCWQKWVVFAVVLLLGGLAATITNHLIPASFARKLVEWIECTTPVFASVAFYQTDVQLARFYVQRAIPDHCRSCGYDLTANVSGTCPECGAMRNSAKQSTVGVDARSIGLVWLGILLISALAMLIGSCLFLMAQRVSR